MKSEDDLTFSSEVAETLGIECSVILSLYNKNELKVHIINSIHQTISEIIRGAIKFEDVKIISPLPKV